MSITIFSLLTYLNYRLFPIWMASARRDMKGVKKRGAGVVKLPAHPVRTGQAHRGFPGTPVGEQHVSTGSLLHIVPFDPAGHVPATGSKGGAL